MSAVTVRSFINECWGHTGPIQQTRNLIVVAEPPGVAALDADLRMSSS